MDISIEAITYSLFTQAKNTDCKLTAKRVDEEGYIISNEAAEKIVALGVLHIKDDNGEKQEIIGGFTIDAKKYKWAEAEGFTHDQMIDDLNGEIFDLIAVDEILDYLCN